MTTRVLSYSEVSTALACWARHDFRYVGRLAGNALRPRMIAPTLSRGRAWGAGIAAWHATGGRDLWDAYAAILASLRADEDAQRAAGLPVLAGQIVEDYDHLAQVFADHVDRTAPLANLSRLEESVVVPLRSRKRRNASNRYRFEAKIDGWTTDADGRAWVVEFKLRKHLQSVEVISLSRQIRWYAWALRQAKGIDPVGVIVDERLNEVPRPPRLVRAKKKGDGVDGLVPSHATDQLCTPEAYAAVCEEFGVEPVAATVDAFRRRAWGQRVPILFTQGELDEAGDELTSAGKLIGYLDSGRLQPVRNVSPMTCRTCDFRGVCSDPRNASHVDALFERVEAKRDRPVAA